MLAYSLTDHRFEERRTSECGKGAALLTSERTRKSWRFGEMRFHGRKKKEQQQGKNMEAGTCGAGHE